MFRKANRRKKVTKLNNRKNKIIMNTSKMKMVSLKYKIQALTKKNVNSLIAKNQSSLQQQPAAKSQEPAKEITKEE